MTYRDDVSRHSDYSSIRRSVVRAYHKPVRQNLEAPPQQAENREYTQTTQIPTALTFTCPPVGTGVVSYGFWNRGLGLLLSPSGMALLSKETAYNVAQWVALPGQLFLAMIQMVDIPLVISSIILGITSSGDASFLKKGRSANRALLCRHHHYRRRARYRCVDHVAPRQLHR